MAIKIPSAKIYEIENPKISDNLIDYIEVNANQAAPTYKVKVNVLDKKFDTKNASLFSRNQELKDFKYRYMGSGHEDNEQAIPYVETFAYTRIQANYLRTSFWIQRNKLDSYITKLYNLLDEYGAANIKFQANCVKYIGECFYKVKFTRDYINGDVSNAIIVGDPTHTFSGMAGYEAMPYPPSGTITIDDFISYFDKNGDPAYAEVESTATVDFNDSKYSSTIYTNLGDIQLIEQPTQIGLNFLMVMVGCTIDTISNKYNIVNGRPTSAEEKTIRGTSVYYAPESVTITFQGDEKGLGIEEITIPIPTEKGSNPFEIEGSELLQSTNYIGSEDTNALTKHYTDLISQYANGKETATIRCSISDYYDENGTKIVSSDNSTNKMTFDIYDEVIPMVYTNDGDVPMSTYSDGSPKIFKVLGVVPDYRGAVYQKLYLQEI